MTILWMPLGEKILDLCSMLLCWRYISFNALGWHLIQQGVSSMLGYFTIHLYPTSQSEQNDVSVFARKANVCFFIFNSVIRKSFWLLTNLWIYQFDFCCWSFQITLRFNSTKIVTVAFSDLIKWDVQCQWMQLMFFWNSKCL